MMKFALFAWLVIVSGVLMAQGDEQLKSGAGNMVVQTLLSEPDGVAIILQADGSFQIFARGTGVYDFDDADDVADARKEGELKAKSALARFLKEEVKSVQSLDVVSKKTKVMSTDGTVQSKGATKEQVSVLTTSITNSAAAILSGMICLRDEKVPGSGSSGRVQVTMGISSKTLAVAKRLGGALSGQSCPIPRPVSRPVTPGPNKEEVRKAKTDF